MPNQSHLWIGKQKPYVKKGKQTKKTIENKQTLEQLIPEVQRSFNTGKSINVIHHWGKTEWVEK